MNNALLSFQSRSYAGTNDNTMNRYYSPNNTVSLRYLNLMDTTQKRNLAKTLKYTPENLEIFLCIAKDTHPEVRYALAKYNPKVPVAALVLLSKDVKTDCRSLEIRRIAAERLAKEHGIRVNAGAR